MTTTMPPLPQPLQPAPQGRGNAMRSMDQPALLGEKSGAGLQFAQMLVAQSDGAGPGATVGNGSGPAASGREPLRQLSGSVRQAEWAEAAAVPAGAGSEVLQDASVTAAGGHDPMIAVAVPAPQKMVPDAAAGSVAGPAVAVARPGEGDGAARRAGAWTAPRSAGVPADVPRPQQPVAPHASDDRKAERRPAQLQTARDGQSLTGPAPATLGETKVEPDVISQRASPAPAADTAARPVAVRSGVVLSDREVAPMRAGFDSTTETGQPQMTAPGARTTASSSLSQAFAGQVRIVDPGADMPAPATARRVIIRLEPAHLGTVTVHLSRRAEGMEVRIMPDRAATAETLKLDSASLMRVLKLSGAQPDAVAVQIIEPERALLPGPTLPASGPGAVSAGADPQQFGNSPAQQNRQGNDHQRQQSENTRAFAHRDGEDPQGSDRGGGEPDAVYI